MRNVLMLAAIFMISVSSVKAEEVKAATAPAVAPVVVPKVVVPTPVVAAPATAMSEKTALGTIKTVSVADATKGTKSEIVLTDEKGATLNFIVTSMTTLYDADAKALMLDKIMSNSKVSIVYTVTSEGLNEAKSVKMIK